jgi:mannose-1-phosphate guanylyltransferase
VSSEPTARHTYALVLAAGAGTRLAAFTHDGTGDVVPKQFCRRLSSETLFEATLRRARTLVPPSRIAVVLSSSHRRWWQSQTSGVGGDGLVLQPADRGTAAGLLLGVQHLLARDAGAGILVLPSDHLMRDEAAYLDSLIDVVAAMQADEARVILLGMPCEDLDPGYGWILACGPRLSPAMDVSSVHHEVPPGVVEQFRRRDALLDSLVLAGTGSALIAAYARALPLVLSRFQLALGIERDPPPSRVQELYRTLPTLDVARHVLKRVTNVLRVVRGRGCGWTDLDTPDRLALHGRCLIDASRGGRVSPARERRHEDARRFS